MKDQAIRRVIYMILTLLRIETAPVTASQELNLQGLIEITWVPGGDSHILMTWEEGRRMIKKQQRGHCLPPGPQEMGKETRVLEKTQRSRRREHLRTPEALGRGVCQ